MGAAVIPGCVPRRYYSRRFLPLMATQTSTLPSDTNAGGAGTDALRARETSPWSFGMKVRRVLWMLGGSVLFRCSFHNWYAWRRVVLRCFGATIGPGVRVRPTVRIEMPW